MLISESGWLALFRRVRILIIGYWLLGIGCWLLGIGYWLLGIGYWVLVMALFLCSSRGLGSALLTPLEGRLGKRRGRGRRQGEKAQGERTGKKAQGKSTGKQHREKAAGAPFRWCQGQWTSIDARGVESGSSPPPATGRSACTGTVTLGG